MLHHSRFRGATAAGLFGLVIALPLTAGCLVPQPLGNGVESRVTEPRTGAEYYLYLPEAYVKNNGVHPSDPNRRWPLVMTFHGMKPWDTWDRQIHEWQQQADAYGYIVCAPWLQTCDSLAEFPPTAERSYVLRDKEAVIAVMDHVLATTRADPKAVLSTSWSSGGFIAHYMPNRFPHRFSCVATRLSNFSPYIMTDATAPLYRNTPVAVFIGEADFPACVTESQAAVAWYETRGFTQVTAKMIDSMNHQRIPQTAAAFFARQLGIEPLKPDVATRTIAQIRMHDWRPDEQLLARMRPSPDSPAAVTSRDNGGVTIPGNTDPAASRDVPPESRGTARNVSDVRTPYRPPSAGPQDYPRNSLTDDLKIGPISAADTLTASSGGTPIPQRMRPVNIVVNGATRGLQPLYLSFGTDMAADLVASGKFLWTHNGAPICDTPRGVKMLNDPGIHNLAVLVTMPDGSEYRGSTTIEVLRRRTASTNR